MSIRTPLGRVRGLGSAKSGTDHWLFQRITAIALIPLFVWVAYLFLCVSLGTKAEVVEWLSSPTQTLLLGALIVAGCLHAKLGCQVIIEDYVHGALPRTLLLLINIIGFTVLTGMGLMAIFALHTL